MQAAEMQASQAAKHRQQLEYAGLDRVIEIKVDRADREMSNEESGS